MAVGANQPFGNASATLTIAAGATSVSGALPPGQADGSVLVFNSTTFVAFVRLDAGPATTNDIPVPPNGRILLQCNQFITNASAILIGTTPSGNIYFTRGVGSVY